MASSSNSLLEVRNVHKRFGQVVALNGASVHLKRGEVRALIGGNGSGKSTLSKVLMGIVAPDQAEVTLQGQTSDGTEGLQELRIGGTFQEVSLLDDLSVEENLLLAHLPRKVGVIASPRSAREVTTAALERVLLPVSVLRSKVRDLPLDQRALAELAKVLLSEPQIVIMDELTASLRSEQVEQIGILLKELSSSDVTTLFVSHRLEEVEEFCTSCTVLRNGSTVLDTDDISAYSMADYVAAMTAIGDQAGSTRTRRASNIEAGRVVLDVEGLRVEGWHEEVDIRAHEGEIVGLGGLAGNGQSEILRAIYGSIPSHHRRFEIDGEPAGHRSVRTSMRRGLGFISGEREREMAFSQRTVGENLSVVARSLRKAISSTDLMERMKVVGRPEHSMRNLSGGNQQKVIVGRWLELRPRILLADDPTRGVDVGTREEIHMLLRELADGGSAVILTSSDDRELAEICDRVYVLYRSRVVAELTDGEVTEEQIGRVSVHPKFQERIG